jgi:nicotinamidase-related amidase
MDYSVDDPYLNWRRPLPTLKLKSGTTALLVTDVQYSDASINHGIFAQKRERGLTAGLDYYAEAMSDAVPNIRRLQDAFRAARIEVLFSRNQAATQNGRDRGKNPECALANSRHRRQPPGERVRGTDRAHGHRGRAPDRA